MNASTLLFLGLFLSGLLGNGRAFGAEPSHTTRTDSGGGVTVKVTFLDSKVSDDLRFQVALDTHSVNLDRYDLKTIAVLRDDTGKEYSPKEVENKGSGHHREATVTFARLPTGSKRVDLVMKDVAGVKERTFRWDLE